MKSTIISCKRNEEYRVGSVKVVVQIFPLLMLFSEKDEKQKSQFANLLLLEFVK